MKQLSIKLLKTQPLFYTFVLIFIKLILLRYFLFNEILWGRTIADGLALLAILCIFELVTSARWKGIVYWILNLIMSFILFSSTVYFAHFGSVPTYTALLQLNQVMQIQASVQSTIKPSYYVFFVDLAITAIIWILFLRRNKENRVPKRNIVWKTGVILAAILCFTLSERYIQLASSISNEIVQAENLGFLNYQVAAAIKTTKEATALKNGNLKDTIQKINQLEGTYAYQDASSATKTPAYFGAAKGKNLIIVQMEAFQNFPIHLSLAGQELTPVLNNLVDNSLYFPHIFQQIGQGNTSDAEFISNTSIYPTGTIPMSTGFGDRALPSLPRLLEKYGYEADTFHVNSVTFWDRVKLYPALHFDQYFDKPYYNNDHFNDFGASDEELYRVGAQKISDIVKKNKPFYTQFVTVSSHFPFQVPDDRKRITLPDSLKGTQLGDYLTAINYTDYALGTFIERLKQEGLWDNTVLVLYGDHFGLQPQDNDPNWVSSQLGITYDPVVSRFNIPLIIHLPGENKGKVINQVGGQLDILPTVANLMGISLKKEHFVAFGHDLLNINHNAFGIRYYLPTGSFINDDVLFIPGKGFDDGTATSLKTLKPVQDITPYRKDYDYVLKMMGLSDEYVQLLPKRE
ncbi:LTA synthase family protein [Paenibacillus sediminis]|uniref:Phosphoglycerol transferase MdoB-like AlkP superfamily enzyme n=1 Tax=Paenibacillus sediminis TaxID=664909 RepID=A0ABS4H0P5_9BACL|nr:LTA synthase family protein [Paenibacillus sediminis]MBP1936107.1 phosphoglycerol transferase MdoB-like AlkP superfamily enzyme [Paenibacillus sediminis]